MKSRLKFWLKYALALIFHYSGYNHFCFKILKRNYIIMLHRISDKSDVLSISIKERNLACSITWCKKLGPITSIGEVATTNRANNLFAFTFDDGYASVEKILDLPVKAPMTVYLSTGFIGTERNFWATYIEELLLTPDIRRIDLNDFDLGSYDLKCMRQRRQAITTLNNRIKQRHPSAIEELMQYLEVEFSAYTKTESNFLTWQQVKQLAKEGITIGSHTHNHAITSKISRQEFESELRQSNELIEQHIGTRAVHFAYPNGQKCDIAEFCPQVLADAGFLSAVTTIEGANTAACDPYLLKRFNLTDKRMENPLGKPSLAMFTTMLNNPLGIH